jgi:hypothetical protein
MVLYGLGFVQSCICPNNGFSTTFVTVETARGLFYSFDENGIFPYLDSFDRTELGISILSDSTSERIEISQLIPTIITSAYACQDPHRTEYVNLIDSVNIFTKYRFDSQHDAGSNINDILKPLDIFGETTDGTTIEDLSFFNQHLKFSATPEADSMQFIITGRIGGKGNFSTQTSLVILKE